MAVKVFFESSRDSTLVALFNGEEAYDVCIEPLQKLAKKYSLLMYEVNDSKDMKPDKLREAVIQAAKDSLDDRYLSIAAPAHSLEEFRGMDSASIFRKLWESSQLNKI
jgi:hypothetical protein